MAGRSDSVDPPPPRGDSYFVVPGGGVEEGETVIEAAHREAAEETGLQIELGGLLWERPFTTLISNGEEIQQVEYAYLITQFSGEPRLGGPEFERQSETNRYSLAAAPGRIPTALSIHLAQT
ncbi:MAG: NUDIX domain-containing protein [Chloroflexi bacterium]|nr:NUDIX domain-containing protein [Chloroflexota bacterium]